MEARPGQSSAANKFGIREGWIDFQIPGARPAHVKVGHQFLQLGNGWFFRSMKYGSDAWLVGLPGKNTIAFVDVKAAENTTTQADDIDAYVLLDNFKIDDTKTVGIYFARVADKRNLLFGQLAWVPRDGSQPGQHRPLVQRQARPGESPGRVRLPDGQGKGLRRDP